MKKLKLSGRERAVIRSLDSSSGTVGEEVRTRTGIEPDDLVDVLNGLIGVGLVETVPYSEATTLETFRTVVFEVNPSYALDIREALLDR